MGNRRPTKASETCWVCGVRFKPNSNAQKRCSDCAVPPSINVRFVQCVGCGKLVACRTLKRMFCTNSCAQRHRRNELFHTARCHFCGDEFATSKTKIREGVKYCSPECRWEASL